MREQGEGMKQRRVRSVNHKGKVRVAGTRQWRHIIGTCNEWGGVRLDAPVDGLSLWNVSELRYIPRKRKKEKP